HPVGTPLQDVIGASVRNTLWALFASVLVLLLIVCVNLANLMLARAHARVREFSIRSALGAGRGRLMQQLLTEALFISAFSSVLGTGLAMGFIQAVKMSGTIELPRLME